MSTKRVSEMTDNEILEMAGGAEEIGAVELAEQGDYLVVSLTASGVRLQRDSASGVAEPVDLDLHHARWLHTVLGNAIDKAAKEGL